MAAEQPSVITGRCYCGAIAFRARAEPLVVAYCHCADCRRATGAPVTAFAAFADGSVVFEPDEGKRIQASPGVDRTFCPDCGSLLTGRYDYIPDQVYISLGLIDQADRLAPEIHAHHGERLSWLHIADNADRSEATASESLTAAKNPK